MTLYCDLNMMLGYVKNRQPVLFHSHPGQLGIKWDTPKGLFISQARPMDLLFLDVVHGQAADTAKSTY